MTWALGPLLLANPLWAAATRCTTYKDYRALRPKY